MLCATAKRHRQFVREHLGVSYEPEKVRAIAEQTIRAEVNATFLTQVAGRLGRPSGHGRSRCCGWIQVRAAASSTGSRPRRGAATVGTFEQRLAHVQTLDAIGATRCRWRAFRRAKSAISQARRGWTVPAVADGREQ